MARKVYEISFAIAGKMASGFGGTFTYASSRISQLRNDIQILNSQYKKGTIPLEEYSRRHRQLTGQILETERAQKLLNGAMQRQRDITSSITRAAVTSVRNTMTIGAGAVAVGGGVFLGSSVKKAMDFESQLRSIQALTGITDDQLAEMTALALEMGAKTKYSALEAAQGIEELLKAGIDPATVTAGGLEAALNLATAGSLDLTEAAEGMSDALNGFKKDGMSAADAANIMAGAANASSTDVRKLKESLSAVGPVADGIGANFRGVNAVLAAFSNNMLKGSDAGTSLKSFLSNVQPQTKEARELFAKFGISAADGSKNIFFANGQLKDMADVAGILQEKFKNLNDQQRSDVFFNLFGSDAVRAATILYKEGANGIKNMYDQMSKVTALDVAKKKMDTAAGSVEQFKGALETLQISALMPTMPLIKRLAESAADFATKYTPRITAAIENAVNTAKGYLKTHFADNPEFQQLSTKGKIEFVINDFKNTFNTWYAGGGQQQIEDAAKSVVDFIGTSMKDSKPIADAATKLGSAMGKGLLEGLQGFIKDNPMLSALMTFMATPGPIPVKLAAAGLVGGTGTIENAVDNAQSRDGQQIRDTYNAIQSIEEKAKSTPAGQPLYGQGALSAGHNDTAWEQFKNNPLWLRSLQRSVRGYASGGIATKPHLGLVAEAGWPEAMIPINNSTRSKSLWLTVGSQLGMLSEGNNTSVWQTAADKVGAQGSGASITINAPFAPVINGGSTEELVPAMEEQRRNYLNELEGFFRQQRRVSYSG